MDDFEIDELARRVTRHLDDLIDRFEDLDSDPIDEIEMIRQAGYVLAEKHRRRIENLVSKKLKWQEVGF